MNIAMWILAGGMLGWIGYTFLNANEERGVVASIIIGAIGGFAGGKVLAPMFGAVPSNEFSLLSMVVAVGCAMGILALANMISNRFNV